MVRTYPYPLPLPRFGIRIHVTGDEWQIALFCSFSCPSSAAHIITPHSPFGFWCTIPTSDSNTAADNNLYQRWQFMFIIIAVLAAGYLYPCCVAGPYDDRVLAASAYKALLHIYFVYIYTCASLWNGVCVCCFPSGPYRLCERKNQWTGRRIKWFWIELILLLSNYLWLLIIINVFICYFPITILILLHHNN